MKLPKFKSEAEEVDFWDRFDTAQILEEEEEIELEYKPQNSDKDKEEFYVRIPVEIVNCLDVNEKKITGGAGFVGSHVAEYYATKNEEVINFDIHTAAQTAVTTSLANRPKDRF